MDDVTSLNRGKRPRTVFAGPYGHPFHPILVTIPIGTWIASLVFDLLAIFSEEPTPLLLGAQILIAIGVIGALAAAVLGFLDLSVIPGGTVAKKTALIHMALNLAAVALFSINYLVRVVTGRQEVSAVGLVLTILGLLTISVSGYLGGRLAYRYGVRVAAEETQADGFR